MCWPAFRLVCLKVLVDDFPRDTEAYRDRITNTSEAKEKGFSFLSTLAALRVVFRSTFSKM